MSELDVRFRRSAKRVEGESAMVLSGTSKEGLPVVEGRQMYPCEVAVAPSSDLH